MDYINQIQDAVVNLVSGKTEPDIPWPRDITITLSRDSVGWTIKDGGIPGTTVEIGIETSGVYETSGIILKKGDRSGTFELKNVHESNKIKISAKDKDIVYISEMRYKTGKIDKLIERDFWLHGRDSCKQTIGMYAAEWITFKSDGVLDDSNCCKKEAQPYQPSECSTGHEPYPEYIELTGSCKKDKLNAHNLYGPYARIGTKSGRPSYKRDEPNENGKDIYLQFDQWIRSWTIGTKYPNSAIQEKIEMKTDIILEKYYQNSSINCWDQCGQTDGPCPFCGTEGSCCHTSNAGGCNDRQLIAVLQDNPVCIVSIPGYEYDPTMVEPYSWKGRYVYNVGSLQTHYKQCQDGVIVRQVFPEPPPEPAPKPDPMLSPTALAFIVLGVLVVVGIIVLALLGKLVKVIFCCSAKKDAENAEKDAEKAGKDAEKSADSNDQGVKAKIRNSIGKIMPKGEKSKKKGKKYAAKEAPAKESAKENP